MICLRKANQQGPFCRKYGLVADRRPPLHSRPPRRLPGEGIEMPRSGRRGRIGQVSVWHERAEHTGQAGEPHAAQRWRR